MDLKSMLNEASVAAPQTAVPAAQAPQQPMRHHTYPSHHGNLASSQTWQGPQPEKNPYPISIRPPHSRSPSASHESALSPSQNTVASTSSAHSGGIPHSSSILSPIRYRSSSMRKNPYPENNNPNPSNSHPNHSGSLVSSPAESFHHIAPPRSAAPHSHLQAGSCSTLPAPGPTSAYDAARSSPASRSDSAHPGGQILSPPTSRSLASSAIGGPQASFLQKSSSQNLSGSSAHGLNYARSPSGDSPSASHGQDIADRISAHPQKVPSRESSLRQLSQDYKRNSSLSVSPKTIPLPSPLPRSSIDQSQKQMTSPLQRRSVSASTDLNAVLLPSVENNPHTTPTAPVSITKPPGQTSPFPETTKQHSTPFAQDMTPSVPSTVATSMQASQAVKRTASAIADAESSPHLSRKRMKPADIPIFAQSARPNRRPVRLMNKDSARTSLPNAEMGNGINTMNGHVNDVSVAGSIPAASLMLPAERDDWEPSIMGSTPYEELTRHICDVIYSTVGVEDPPTDGAVFEIEAKLGEIHNIEEGRRLRLPVMTETVFDKVHFSSPTRFESSMNVEQHRALNAYLNNLCAESQQPSRTPILYDHPREIDTFYSLTAAGEATLPPSIRKYLNPKHRPRVRVTTAPGNSGPPSETNPPVIKRRIIKSRITDLDVLCPSLAFDYRISISIESPYDGPDDVLVKINDAGGAGASASGDREKDRVSYRHLAYQIDLTQVSYPNSTRREHELEVEIATQTIRQELSNLSQGRPNRYEDLVRGFLDNVRILARRGTLYGFGHGRP